MENLSEEIKESFVQLPMSLQRYILESGWRDIAKNIAQNFGLDEEQADITKSETFYVLLGISPISEFRTNIISEAGLTYDQALKVTSETNSRVFNAVIGELKTLENAMNSNEEQQARPAPQQPRPVPQPPKNLPTEENILLRQTEIPTYKLPDHEHMKEQHAHTPTQPQNQNRPPQPSQGPVQPQTIIDQKLSQIVRLPKEEVKVDLDEVEERRKNSYRGNDPYREPTE